MLPRDIMFTTAAQFGNRAGAKEDEDVIRQIYYAPFGNLGILFVRFWAPSAASIGISKSPIHYTSINMNLQQKSMRTDANDHEDNLTGC